MKVMKRALFFVFLPFFMSAILQACTNADAEQKSILSDNDSRLIVRARDITANYSLTDIPLSCLDFAVAEEEFNGNRLVVVREKHDGECGGDPDTSPRLFSIAFDEATNEIWSDAKSLLGQMEVIHK